MAAESGTRELLEALHRGEERAIAEILQRHLPWIRDRVRLRLGGILRWKAETDDFVQEAAAAFLRYGPRCLLSGEEELRALLARIVENVLRDEHDRWRTIRRDVLRERALPTDSVLELDLPAASGASPSRNAARTETREWVRLALELLEPDDRRVIQARELDELSFAEAGARLGISEDAVRKRFDRAFKRLAATVRSLQGGRLRDLLGNA